MAQSDIARLDIRCSTEPKTGARTVLLTDPVTNIGRLEAGVPGVSLEGMQISRQHARITREESDAGVHYAVENVRGRAGVRIYEHLLLPGERHTLLHGYCFQIPGLTAGPDEPLYQFTFRSDDHQTTCLAFELSPPATIRIFGTIVPFTPQEYAMLDCLCRHAHTLCTYAMVIAAVWARPRTPEGRQAYLAQLHTDPDLLSVKREALDIILVKVRAKIRAASGGLTLIETIRGEGLCLRACCVSAVRRDP
jgi:hypothetical protein